MRVAGLLDGQAAFQTFHPSALHLYMDNLETHIHLTSEAVDSYKDLKAQ